MKRQAIKELQRWKASPRRKPLIVSGARQVGKTWLMKEFGNTCFERFAYVTFDDNPQLVAAFGGSLSPQRLLPILQAEAGVRIDGSTLLILDEIQESPRAIQSLKYFNEQMPHLPVVAGRLGFGPCPSLRQEGAGEREAETVVSRGEGELPRSVPLEFLGVPRRYW